MERIRRHTDKPITDDWKDVVEEILMQEVPKRAQAIADKEPGQSPSSFACLSRSSSGSGGRLTTWSPQTGRRTAHASRMRKYAFATDLVLRISVTTYPLQKG